MERLSVRVFVVAAMLCVVGVIVVAVPKKRPPGRTESWMETQAPKSVGDYKFAPPAGAANPEQSYRMDPETYKLLTPYGIVCRVYEHAGRRFDVVLIASNSRSSFHDPRVCFSGHGWKFDDAKRVVVSTRSRGDVPATYIEGKDENGADVCAAYLYQGPGGFSASTLGIKWLLLKHLVVSPFDTAEGVFYRFISQDPGAKQDDFLKFIGDYLDAAGASSGGYF